VSDINSLIEQEGYNNVILLEPVDVGRKFQSVDSISISIFKIVALLLFSSILISEYDDSWIFTHRHPVVLPIAVEEGAGLKGNHVDVIVMRVVLLYPSVSLKRSDIFNDEEDGRCLMIRYVIFSIRGSSHD